jgi:hypothetical protein
MTKRLTPEQRATERAAAEKARTEARIAELVKSWPPLDPETKERLRELLWGSDAGRGQ